MQLSIEVLTRLQIDPMLTSNRKNLRGFPLRPFNILVRPAGFELAAYGFEDRTSEFANLLKLF